MIRRANKLYAFDEQAENENGEARESKPERERSCESENADLTEQTKHTEHNAEPKDNHGGGGKFHSILLELNVKIDFGGSTLHL